MSASLVGCGGGGAGRELPDPGPDAGIDPSTTLSNATPVEQMQICEWIAGRFGGYGRRVTCSDGDYLSGAASCTNLPPDPAGCYHTIGDVESCVDGVVGGCAALPAICLDVLLDCGMPTHASINESARSFLQAGPDVTTTAAPAPAR